ncbi:YbaB/EbfC family nucleoid-associated protein [Namhaeicola litoreus]|uniref:Nucleoid-associated protein ACFQ39_09355 n=1 Tax=Namhaeicola litoreus TaxID=1052145 RepID=A0ABW3Y1V4_9FLAO
MFGDMQGMMAKLKEAQAKIEETKKRLDTVLVNSESGNGAVKMTMTANRTVKSIEISDEVLEDTEVLEDYLILAFNKALEKANSINEFEMAKAAKDGMPNIPGLDMFK